ncbi:MAG: tetratricopeptide repeat protein [Candidatus Krumholzibacteriaceae bacterium]|jgi:tetratricopeptide (TPR) repeat protein
MIRSARRFASVRGTAALAASVVAKAVLAAACLALFLPPGAPASGQAVAQTKGRPKPPASVPGRRPADTPVVMIDRANYFIMQGRCEDAIPILERLVAQYPQVYTANSMLADCYLKGGRSQDAAALLERCLETDAGNRTYLQDLGTAYVDMGRKEQAVEIWRRLLKADDKFGSTYGIVAKMEQEAGLYDEAIATLREGMKFKENADYYAHETIRLERAIGRDEEAFRDALILLGGRPGLAEGEIRSVSDIFRESKKQDRLVSIVDSLVSTGENRNGAYRTLKAILLVEGGRYDDARRHLFGKGASAFRDDQLYSIIVYMSRMTDRRIDARFASLDADLMQQFLDRFNASIYAPGVMFLMASDKREAAGAATGAAREKLLAEALALADDVKRQRLGAPYLESVCLFRAQVLFEDLHRSDEALSELAAIPPGSDAQTPEVVELRMRILLASPNRSEAATVLKRMAADPDTAVACLGRYGLGRLAFLGGRYDESVKILSDLAEKHPSSAWANDALELAMDEKGAMGEGGGALAPYRGAVLAQSRGEFAAAIDSLAALGVRYPESSLAPRALFLKAEIEADAGASGDVHAAAPAAARADFARLAETWPLHDLAPRALERLADLEGRDNPGEAIVQYGQLMERYPDYPFIERVRERYIALGKTTGAESPKKGPK